MIRLDDVRDHTCTPGGWECEGFHHGKAQGWESCPVRLNPSDSHAQRFAREILNVDLWSRDEDQLLELGRALAEAVLSS